MDDSAQGAWSALCLLLVAMEDSARVEFSLGPTRAGAIFDLISQLFSHVIASHSRCQLNAVALDQRLCWSGDQGNSIDWRL